MAGYDFAAIERKWQQRWDDDGTFAQPNPGDDSFADKPKCYVLDMFPYPSGAGLHVGHPEGYTATDIVARFMRMRGVNVLHPMGYDAFGLPAEQYAVEHGVHPRETTQSNIDTIERQIRLFGFSYDWSRRIATTDPDYFKWTQWIFLQLFNSWYDPAAGAARPIEDLIRGLSAGEYVVGVGGDVVYNTADGLAPYLGDMLGTSKWHELTGEQQRAVIDNQRLAYQAEVPVNWCPKLGTVLANEEVTNEGRSERGNWPVYRRNLRQWMLRITCYADRLLNGLDGLDWPESIKIMQRNWIGRSEGANVIFELPDCDEQLEVYTTRPDTLFGATYMVLAPEHPLVEEITTDARRSEVKAYVDAAAGKSELERTAETKEKTGVFTGSYAVNPVNDERIPIWVADYVMMGYGTGAIMAVPAHDTRDFEFAQTFDLPIVQVVAPPEGEDWRGYTGDGVAVNSGEFDGLPTAEFKRKIIDWLEANDRGRRAVNYKLRDWLFSRQRYWGEPFPLVHCPDCGTVPLPEDALPLTLPEMDDFSPQTSDDPDAPPQPPLGKATDWVNTTCPACGGAAVRELNTMPQWAGSCWYYLRFCDPRNDERFCDPTAERYWMSPGGIDLYVGGAEHAVLHLLYARFWHKVLYDLGHVSTPEPFAKLYNQGMIRSFAYRDARGMPVSYEDVEQRDDGVCHRQTGETLTESVEKMSKSLKNVVNPDDVIAEYGADTFRLYEMFMGPLEASKPWNTQDVPGVHRFCHRVWRLIVGNEETPPLLGDRGDEELERALHKLIRKVGEDIQAMKFNTAIAAMMEFVNAAFKAGAIGRDQAERFVLVLAPFAPHLGEELWERLGHGESLAYEPWPDYDEAMIAAETVELAVQVNGKVRGRVAVDADADEEAVIAAALADDKVATAVEGKTIVKKIVVPGRLVNLVVT
ncbi:MAG: leucine--tRNA ligase [Phycisphaerae bacterium]|nr:leucine--tRNA ligase [Phycisphaerae bacterium]